jgi:glycosyltransferase involved in cell wall biosynthesis
VRVVLVSTLERGGPVEQGLLLAAGLAGRGVTVAMACATGEVAERAAAAGARSETIPLRRPLDARGMRAVRRFARGADVVHGLDRRAGLWARVAPPPRPCRRVHTIHGLPDEYLPPPAGRARPGLRATLAYRVLDPLLARRADALIVPSRAVAGVLTSRLGFPAGRIHVIPNGVAPAGAVPTSGDLVGTVSVLHPVKGLDVFLRAAARLAERRPELRFGLYGAGPEGPTLERLAASLGLDGRLEAPGHVPAAEALSRLRVFVLSSYMENAPMALLEAMAAGVPVVATAVGGVPEIVSEDTAQLVPPGDEAALAGAVARLLDDPELAREQAAAARRVVEERFPATANADATLALYERLLAGGPR